MDRDRMIALVEGEARRAAAKAALSEPWAVQQYLEVEAALNAVLSAYRRSTKPPLMTLVIPGPPVTKKNSQRIYRAANGRPVIKPSAQFEQYQKLAEWYIPQKLRQKLDQPVTVRARYYMPTRRRVDLVNLLEATCDILVHCGVLADDNSNIVVSHDGSCRLYDKATPRTEIEIVEAGEGEPVYGSFDRPNHPV